MRIKALSDDGSLYHSTLYMPLPSTYQSEGLEGMTLLPTGPHLLDVDSVAYMLRTL